MLATLRVKLGNASFKTLLKSNKPGEITALMQAVIAGSRGNVLYLLSNKEFSIDPNESTPDDHTEMPSCDYAIDYAVYAFNQSVFEFLLVFRAIIHPHTWDYIFDENNHEQLKEDYLNPRKFLESINSPLRQIFYFFLAYFDECRRRGINTALFFSVKNEKKENALLVAVKNKRHARFEKLIDYPISRQEVDADNHTILYYLMQQGKHDLIQKVSEKDWPKRFIPQVTTELKAGLKGFDFKDVSTSKKIGALLTGPLGISQKGRYPLANPDEVIRPYRSFAGHRTRQILRHLASQIYFAIHEIDKTLEEVQAMYLSYKGHDYVFLTGNPIETFTRHCAPFCSKDALRQAITKSYYYTTGHDDEKNLRTARYAAKLMQRIYDQIPRPRSVGDADDDLHRSEKLSEIVREAKVELWNIGDITQGKLDILKAPLKYNSIFILHLPGLISQSFKLRHAEEFLVDVIDNLPPLLASAPPTYTCIAGKKRPCLGCSGRQTGVVSEFGEFPGRYWLHSMEYQSIKESKRTAALLLNSASHVSVTKDGMKVAEFDSGSDSEPEG